MTWAQPGQLGYRQSDITVALRNGTTDQPENVLSDSGKMHVLPYLWNPNTLQYEVSTASTASGSVTVSNFPATQPVSVADGADVNQGTTTDAAVTTDVAGTMAGKLRGLVKIFNSVWDSGNGRLKVDGSGVTQPVTITPVSVSATGTLTTSGQTVTLTLGNSQSAGILITGTWTGTISFEASPDSGTTWGAYEFYNPVTSVEQTASSTTGNGFFQLINIAAVTNIRARASAAMTGTANLTLTGTVAATNIAPYIKENGTTAPSYGVMVGGTDGTLMRYMRTAADGTVRVDPTGTTAQPVTGTFWQATQPVSQPAATDWRVDLRRGLTVQFAVISATASGDNAIVAASVGNKIKVLQYTLVADSAVVATFRNGTTPITGAMSLAANGGVSSPFVAAGQGHLFETSVNTALNLNLGSAVGVRGHIAYILEA